MPLPAYLLERLKKRNVIPDVVNNSSESQNINTLELTEQNDKPLLQEQNIDEEQEEIIAEDYSDDDEEEDRDSDIERNLSKDISDDEKKIQDQEQNSNNSEGINSKTNESGNNTSTFIANNESEVEKNHGTGDDVMTNHDNNSVNVNLSVIGCPNKYNIYHHCSQYCVDNYSNPKNVSPTMEQRRQLAFLLKTYPVSNDWTVVYDPGIKTFYFWNIVSNLVSWLPPGMNGLISLSADQIRRSMVDQKQKQDSNECFE